ncbi:MAG: hypothetical protein Q8N99_07805 [Nanoarchaeota archaeon]|nr:hypothetical protein [Nanoarchaeota archaeon]
MKKPIKTAAFSGLILIIVWTITNLLFLVIDYDNTIGKTSLNYFFILINWMQYLLIIFFYYGFACLGKRFNSRLLKIMSWIMIILGFLLLFYSVYSQTLSIVRPVSAQDNIGDIIKNYDSEINLNNYPDAQKQAMEKLALTAWLIISIGFGIITILFGIGILNLGNKIRLSKVAGILNIIAGSTYLIYIGFFIKFIAMIFEISLLFLASKRFER